MVRIVRNKEEAKSNYSSFILPVIIALIIVIFIAKLLFGGSSENLNRSGNYVTIDPGKENAETYIYMSGDSKKQIDSPTKMYATDNKVEVVNADAIITLDNDASKFFLNKLGELKYEGIIGEKQVFGLLNSQLWAEIQTPNFEFNLKNFTVSPKENSVLAFSQNMMASNVYILKGEATIKLNTEGKEQISGVLGVGQKVTILNSDLKNETLKFTDKIEPIDDMFKIEDWFIKHNGGNYLNLFSSGSEFSSSGKTSTGSLNFPTNQKQIIFIYPEDGSTIEGNIVDIEGKIVNDNIIKITLNDEEISLNKKEKTFIAKGFKLSNAINNIVYKAYNINNDEILKGVLTLYTSSTVEKVGVNKPTVTTYPISSKDFKIIAPQDNPYKTTENVVKIVGQVNKGAVKFITINGFRLTKYSQYSTYWYYFANKDYGTMNDGINLYNIKYYGKNDELLSENLFTIVKETIEPKVEDPTIIFPPSSSASGSIDTASGTTNG